jgi:hypothetical protein
MPKPIDEPFRECQAAGGSVQPHAVLDELTLTYTVVERGHGGRTRELRRHVSSLRDARRWATVYPRPGTCADDPKADRAA